MISQFDEYATAVERIITPDEDSFGRQNFDPPKRCRLRYGGCDAQARHCYTSAGEFGLEQLKLMHVNDATDPLGSNRDRHAPIGKGEIGRRGFRAFLGERRLQKVPAVLEGPGIDGHDVEKKDVQLVRRLWREATKR